MFNNCSKSFSQENEVSAAEASVDGLMQAITSCDLSKLEIFIREFKYEPNELIPIVERLGNLVNSPEIRITARKFSWKQGSVVRWGVVCQFNLVRAQRILLVPTEKEFPSAVLEHSSGKVGVVSTDCPKLMLRQIGRIANLRSASCPPPLMSNSISNCPPPPMSGSMSNVVRFQPAI